MRGKSLEVELSCADAVDWLAGLPTESADLVLTDPAYESLEKHRALGTTTRLKRSKASSNDWFSTFPNARFAELLAQTYRVLRPNRHFYMFCDSETMFVVKPLAEAAGFKFWKPLIWDKVSIGMGYHYRSRHEYILFFEKGKRRLRDLAVADVLAFPRVHRGYPTEKPVGLAEVLIEQSTIQGEGVIDPFMGSGTFGVASLKSKRHFRGNDIAPEAVRRAVKRIESAQSTHRVRIQTPLVLQREPGLHTEVST